MSDTVKLIIEILKDAYDATRSDVFLHDIAFDIWMATRNGTPLDSYSEKPEVQAYFAGGAYGWETGRKVLIDEIKAEIKRMEYHMIDCDVLVSQEEVLDIIDKYKAESEE